MEMLFAGASFQRVDVIVCCYDMSGASSQPGAGEEECRRIHQEIVPDWLRPAMQRLDQYESTPDHLYLLYALKRGGWLRSVVHNLLKLINFLFIHIDRSRVYFHRLPGRCPELPQ